jgi:hypothetical protein
MSCSRSPRLRLDARTVRRLLATGCLVALAAIASAVPTQAGASGGMSQRLAGTPVPIGFVGVNIGGPLFSDNVNLDQQFNVIVASGAQSVRVVFNWAQAQPYKTLGDVPSDQQANYVDENGVPTSFAATDQIVAAAAARGLALLPTVLVAPNWDAGTNRQGGLAPPADLNAYGNYLRTLIGRYGPHGTFWQSHRPRVPIRAWQIWNEPNLSTYWPQPFAASYVRLLRVAHAAVKRADPGAKVVLGAITNYAWKYIGQIYAIRGAHRLFDVIAVNGFTTTPNNVILFLELVRRAVNRLGDRQKPILATEISWPSAAGQPVRHQDWDTTEWGQARNIAALLPMLAAQRASLLLSGFYYYTWVTQSGLPANDDFSYAGLLNYEPTSGQIIAKPALAAFRGAALRLELCGKKGFQATQCLRRLK